MNNNIEQHITNTLHLVDTLPNEYRKDAFQIILKYFISLDNNKIKSTQQNKTPNTKEKNDIDVILNSNYNWSAHKILNKRPLEQMLLVIKIALEEFDIDGLSPLDIKIILSQKLRIMRTTNAISMSLMSQVGKLVDRISEGNKFRYRITADGINRVNKIIQNG